MKKVDHPGSVEPPVPDFPALPLRVQLSRAKGWKMPPNTVKVDRSSGFGNPFPIAKCKSTTMGVTRDTWCVGTWSGPAMWFVDTKDEAAQLAVKAYRAWRPLHVSTERIQHALRGKNLACWCAHNAPCHADVLLELANAPDAARTEQVERDKSRESS